MTSAAHKKAPSKDGFEVVSIDSREVIHFVDCDYNGSQRERCLNGMLRNMDTDSYFVRDTRDARDGDA